MKKNLIALTVLVLSLFIVTGCGGKTGPAGDSGTGAGSLLNYIPEDAVGYFSVNVAAISKFDIFKEAIEKDFKPSDKFKDYQDFVNKTGIDLKTDLKGVVVGLLGANPMNKKDPDIVAVAGLKYNKEKLLNYIKSEGAKFTEEIYDGLTLYKMEEKGKIMNVAFPDAGHILMASDSMVKKAVALFKGKGKSVLQNEKQKEYMSKLNNNALFSMVFNIPEQMRVKQNMGMGEVDFSKAECFLGSAWRSGSAYEVDLKLLSKNEEGNAKLVSLFGMVKMMGANQPDYKELIEGIKISSDANMIHLTMSISDEFLKKMKDKTKAMFGK